MPDCVTCQLFRHETEVDTCLHVNRPGGLKLTELALNMAQLPERANILDVASGTSATLHYMINQRRYNAVGLDLSSGMLRLSKDVNPELHLIQADCGALPLVDRSQHAVLMECALSLTMNTNNALSEFQRILGADGALIVTDIYIRELAASATAGCLSGTHCLAGAMTEAEIREKVLEMGFTIKIWQDQTVLFKEWMARMVFRLGSLQAFYRQLVSCDDDAEILGMTLGKDIKLGYYLMIAKKANGNADL